MNMRVILLLILTDVRDTKLNYMHLCDVDV